jgi:hypothetical protein
MLILWEKDLWDLATINAIIVSYCFLQLNIFAFNLA